MVDEGAVASSSCVSQRIAAARDVPHISADGLKPAQHAGRSGWPKMAQAFAAVSCTHRIPAGLPWGMPGMALEMDGAVQHAPQCARHGTGKGTPRGNADVTAGMRAMAE